MSSSTTTTTTTPATKSGTEAKSGTCKYGCEQKDIKDLELHYQIDHAMNQGLRDPLAIEGAKVPSHDDRPDLVEAKKVADEEREKSAKAQLHPLLQNKPEEVKKTIVTEVTTTQPTVSTAQKVKSEQENISTASSTTTTASK